MSTRKFTRVSPGARGLAHQEQDDGRVVFYDPEDDVCNLDARWISAETTLNVGDMR